MRHDDSFDVTCPYCGEAVEIYIVIGELYIGFRGFCLVAPNSNCTYALKELYILLRLVRWTVNMLKNSDTDCSKMMHPCFIKGR